MPQSVANLSQAARTLFLDQEGTISVIVISFAHTGWGNTRGPNRIETTLPTMKLASDRRTRVWFALCLGTGIALSLAGAIFSEQREQDKAQLRFTQLVDRVEQDIAMRFEQPVSGLRGLLGFYAASDRISRKDFRDYWEARDIAREFPGVRGFGFIQRVKREELDQFIANEQKDDAPDFAVRTQGNAPELFIVKLIEPLDKNRSSRGFDVASDPGRNEAVQRAIETGEATLSGVLELVHDAKKTPGFLYLLPIFRQGLAPETAAQRAFALSGFSYMPLLARDLLNPTKSQTQDLIDFELYDGMEPSAKGLVFKTDGGPGSELQALEAQGSQIDRNKRTLRRSLTVGGRVLTLHASSTDAFAETINRTFPLLIGAGGSLLSLFVALSLGLLIQGRADAEDEVKRTYKELLLERQRLQNIIDGTNAGTWELDLQTLENRIDVRWADMLGFTLDELEPMNYEKFQSLVHPEDLIDEQSRFRLHVEGTLPFFERELRLRHKNGGWVWIQSRGRVSSRSSKGKPLSISGTHTDISVRKAAELSLMELSTQMQSVLNSATEVAIIATGRDKLIHVFNPGASTMLGYTQEEVIGRCDRSLYHDAQEMRLRAHKLSEQTGKTVEGVGVFIADPVLGRPQEWTCIRKDGSRFAASEVVTEMRSPKGELLGYLSLTQDVTQQKAYEASLKEAKEQAEQATQIKGQFLANMSHEIRTPMNAILGMLNLLKKTPLSKQQQDYTQKTQGAAKSLLGIINDILDFSKVEAGKMALDLQPFRVDRLMRDLSVIVSANVGSKPVEILFDIDPTLPQVLVGDSLRLQQVLINLTGNALKFTEHGTVVLRLQLKALDAEQATVLFSVKDSGIGIASDKQAYIFDGFSQAEADTTRRFGGTGLGLSISKRLVELMGGSLGLESELGVGSNFFFTLPLQLLEDPPESLRKPVRSTVGAKRVLVVDDNPIARELMRIMLNTLGWHAELAEDGPQALGMIEASGSEQPFEVIFLDWQMHGMDGWETARQIRKLGPPKGASEPMLLMVTAHGRDMLEQRTEREQSLLNGFLVKPVTASILLDAVMDASLPDAALRHPSLGNHAERRLQGMRVLVVEDNLINQQVAQELLTHEGALITLASNGQLGVEAIAAANTPFHAVLMDLQMPVLDGFGATREIRATLGKKDLPIIAMTANALESDRQACLAASMNDHVGKPFDLNQLVRVLLQHTGFQAAPGDPQTHRAAHEALAEPPLAAPVKSRLQSDDLDIELAMMRMGGNATLYKQVLQTFVRDLASYPDQLAAHLEQGNTLEATRLLHTLKGLSATVGAQKLSSFAKQAESDLKKGVSAQATPVFLERAQEAIETAARALEAVLLRLDGEKAAPQPTQEPSVLNIDSKAIRSELEELADLLQQSDMTALQVFDQFKARFGLALESTYGKTLTPLQETIWALDFVGAGLECRTLIQEIEK